MGWEGRHRERVDRAAQEIACVSSEGVCSCCIQHPNRTSNSEECWKEGSEAAATNREEERDSRGKQKRSEQASGGGYEEGAMRREMKLAVDDRCATMERGGGRTPEIGVAMMRQHRPACAISPSGQILLASFLLCVHHVRILHRRLEPRGQQVGWHSNS